MIPRIVRRTEKMVGDPRRTIAQLHLPHNPARIEKIIRRVDGLQEKTVASLLAQVRREFSWRHHDIDHIFKHHFEAVREHVPPDSSLGKTKQALIGAYFTNEYAIESAGLFNPSMVPHPDQGGMGPGELRFILSLRATGEGHISSIVFRSGTLDASNRVTFDHVSNYVETPSLNLDPDYDRHLFELKLHEMGSGDETTAWVLHQLPDNFTYTALKEALQKFRQECPQPDAKQIKALEQIDWLVHSNYETAFRPEYPISERVIFPVSNDESCGIEDARFVPFAEDSGKIIYYATYTAYDGSSILPQLIETMDFVTFNIITLNGKAVQNKGMALFPHKIGGCYAMLSRHDGENNYIMFSDHLHFWQEAELMQEPSLPWELAQVGNCGSPLKTEAGWLVLTHGVGPMRRYCIGAILLDLDNPARVIAQLEEPLLTPSGREREAYVPNVTYSCGSLIHNRELVIPYSMSDNHSGLATVSVQELLGCMRRTGS